MNNTQEEIKDIVIDEWIWITFAIISLANVFGDEIDKESLEKNNKRNISARKIFIITAFISLLIYSYFATKNYKKIKTLKMNNKETKLYEIRLLGNIFLAVGVILLIYFNINEKESLNIEAL